jgi:hypothetical protein
MDKLNQSVIEILQEAINSLEIPVDIMEYDEKTLVSIAENIVDAIICDDEFNDMYCDSCDGRRYR